MNRDIEVLKDYLLSAQGAIEDGLTRIETIQQGNVNSEQPRCGICNKDSHIVWSLCDACYTKPKGDGSEKETLEMIMKIAGNIGANVFADYIVSLCKLELESNETKRQDTLQVGKCEHKNREWLKQWSSLDEKRWLCTDCGVTLD